jgi:hypothetical protein
LVTIHIPTSEPTAFDARGRFFAREKNMNRRAFTVASAFLAVLFATTLPQPGFSQSNPQLGTWKINLEKSKHSPGPLPKSQTLIVETVAQGFRSTTESIDAQGNTSKIVRVYQLDEKPYPATGTPDYDAAAYRQVNASTVDITRSKAGKIVQTVSGVTSADGKTLTITGTGVNAKGQQFNNVTVYEKQ